MSCVDAQEPTLSDTILTRLIGDIAVLKHTHELQLNELRAKMQTQEEQMQTQEERIQDLEKKQEQVQLDLRECFDDIRRINNDTVQKYSTVQEKMASHENNLGTLMSVFRSMRKNIESVQTALYHQKVLMINYKSRDKNDTLARLTKLETQFSNASKVSACSCDSYLEESFQCLTESACPYEIAHCVAGSYSSTGRVPCTLCEIGTYQTSIGSKSCKLCEVGSYQASVGSTSCTPCESGSYQASSGSSDCTSCGEGTWTATTGSTENKDCKDYCVAGSYSTTGFAPCTLCEVGSYQASVRSTSCTPCGIGTYQASVGSTTCTLCEIGSYQASVGSTFCTPCEFNSYQASPGSTSCITCSNGTWTATTGSTADTDCKDVGIDCGDTSGTTSGVYMIKPQGVEEPFSVYCDMQTEGEGWTVFQKRQDGSVDFYRDWTSYETGFGDLMGEFWLGNHFIHSITNQGSYELMVNMSDFEGQSAYAHYNVFGVGNASSSYILTVSGYSGNAGDSLVYHNNMKFSTHDRDHDVGSSNCAVSYKGSWWYNDCHHSNLNGMYYGGKHTSYAEGVTWRHWKGYYYSLKSTTMSVRRRH
ncbi:hypothetical protein ScPMuIL_010250 [Solemya velum]